MRVLIADDEPKVRSALHLWLAEVPGLTIVGEVADIWALLDRLPTVQTDVLLLDALLAGLPLYGTFPQVLDAMRWLCPGLTIIGLSPALPPRPALSRMGVTAWVSKLEPPDQLLQVLAHLQASSHLA